MVGNPIQKWLQFYLSKKSHINVSLSQFQNKIPTYPSTIYQKKIQCYDPKINRCNGWSHFVYCWPRLGRQGFIVFRFIIEYSSLRDFGR
jgi:hypothetical protein